jgi:FlaA1/EpsC-like NDP-sugar epimerase
VLVLLLHIFLIFGSLLISWLLRFEFRFKDPRMVLSAVPILMLFRLTALSRFRLLHGHWRYTDIDDAADIAKATAVGSIAFFVSMRYVLGVVAFPLSIYVVEMIVNGCAVAGVRIAFRVMAEAAAHISTGRDRKQVLVIGAGFGAQMILRELRHNDSGHWVIGCLDDDPTKFGLKIQGKEVLGTVDEIAAISAEHGVDEVLIAVPSATGKQMQRFVGLCEESGLKFSTVPSLQDLVSGRAKINEVREVNVDDLLGRDPIKIDLESVRSVLTGKVVLVTGAAGSIGSELCRQILQYSPARLVCLDQSETGLFYLQMELGPRQTYYCVADVTNTERMRWVFETQQVDIVFHAAAYKHVPLMEENPREALHNNVFGLMRLLDVAEAADCQSFIMISSDKAVNPTNVMGATKRIGELMLAARPESSMRCVSVRFGNVLGSQGSVIPVFQRQLAENKPLTVTHPDITRFFMTIREAVSLVLQAAAIGTHRDILVLDMGEPVRIVDLARTLVRLSGKSESQIPISFTGLRPGEKLYEELFYSYEKAMVTQCSKIRRTSGRIVNWLHLKSGLERLRIALFDNSLPQIRSQIKAIVPEYVSEQDMQYEWILVPLLDEQARVAAGDD